MLQVTYNEADRILLDMADEAEAAAEYSQVSFGARCGSPACMLGTYGWNHPESVIGRYIRGEKDWFSMAPKINTLLEIDDDGWDALFSPWGCDHAGEDGKKAAAYVREFVRKRALARIAT